MDMSNMIKFTRYLMPFICVVLFLIFSIRGVSTNHSFWADETYASAIARDVVIGKSTLVQGIQLLSYQPLQIITLATSFSLFGVSEFTARIPSVLWGAVGVFFAYILGTLLSGKRSGGFISAFFLAFSELNLAQATQAKPYTAVETLCLIQFTALFLLDKKPRSFLLHTIILTCITAATLYHTIGIFLFIPYAVWLVLYARRNLHQFISFRFLVAYGICFGIIALLTPIVNQAINVVQFSRGVFPYNFISYFRELFWKQYGLFSLPAFLLLTFLFIHKKKYTTALISYLFFLTVAWNTIQYSHNIRYLVSVFGILFVCAGSFWSVALSKLFPKYASVILIGVMILFFLGGGKLVRKPSIYYSPNQDLYGDVQSADYKRAFAWIKQQYPDIEKKAFFNDLIDAERYYLPEKPSTALFMKGAVQPAQPHPSQPSTIIYSTLDEFLKEKSRYQSGILLVEDWESFLPESIKQYAKKNMKKVARFESLEVSPTDPWPLEVYEW